MSWKHIHLLAEDDEDPMLSAVNLVDVFLVLVVALLTAVAAQSSAGSSFKAEDHVTIIKNPGSPQMEVIVRENGQEVKYKGGGRAGAGQGERAGVAYKLKDGHIVYVPEASASSAANSAATSANGAR